MVAEDPSPPDPLPKQEVPEEPSTNKSRDTPRQPSMTPSQKEEFRQLGPEATVPKKVGRYKVDGQLGKGGFGRVFLATNDLGHQFAIKVPRSKDDVSEAFLREARKLASLNHPNIAKVHEVEQDESGRWFIVL
jgi:serine/threonine protein kinase